MKWKDVKFVFTREEFLEAMEKPQPSVIVWIDRKKRQRSAKQRDTKVYLESMIAACLMGILRCAKEIEGKAEEIKPRDEDLHDFLESRATRISGNVTKLRMFLGLKPLPEYDVEENR